MSIKKEAFYGIKMSKVFWINGGSGGFSLTWCNQFFSNKFACHIKQANFALACTFSCFQWELCNNVKSTLIFDFCGYFLLSWNCLTEVLFLLVKLTTLVSISISFQIFNCLWAVKYLLICGFFLFCFNEQEHQVCDL